LGKDRTGIDAGLWPLMDGLEGDIDGRTLLFPEPGRSWTYGDAFGRARAEQMQSTAQVFASSSDGSYEPAPAPQHHFPQARVSPSPLPDPVEQPQAYADAPVATPPAQQWSPAPYNERKSESGFESVAAVAFIVAALAFGYEFVSEGTATVVPQSTPTSAPQYPQSSPFGQPVPAAPVMMPEAELPAAEAALPAEAQPALELAPSTETPGEIAIETLGVEVVDVTPAMGLKTVAGDPVESGALIQRVTAGTAADRIGLQQGDVIIGVLGRGRVTDALGLTQAVPEEIGRDLSFTIVRGGIKSFASMNRPAS
jgi:hypothetical protein